jgi:hypothetical protein
MMLNGWRIKPAGTVGHRKSVIGTTIAPASIRPAETVAITARTIAGAETIGTSAMRVIPVTAGTGATIPVREIIATIRAETLGDDNHLGWCHVDEGAA